MELENSKTKPQAQALSLSSDTLGPDWDLRNTPYLQSARVPSTPPHPTACILPFQIVTERMKFGLQPTWDFSLPWLMLWVHLEPVLVCLKMQVRAWRRRGGKCCYPPPWYARDAKHFLTGWVWFRREYFLLPELQLPSFIIKPQTFFFFLTHDLAMLLRLAFECSSRSGLSLQRARNWVHRCPSTLLA